MTKEEQIAEQVSARLNGEDIAVVISSCSDTNNYSKGYVHIHMDMMDIHKKEQWIIVKKDEKDACPEFAVGATILFRNNVYCIAIINTVELNPGDTQYEALIKPVVA